MLGVAPEAGAEPPDQGNAAEPATSTGLTYPEAVPLPLRLLLGAVLVLVGVGLLTIAVLGARATLRRNRFVGVRTVATLDSDLAFAHAHRVAAPLLGAAGAVGVAGGATVLAGGPAATTVTVLVLAGIGVLVLAGAGGALGDRAAASLAEPVAEPGACAGVCQGCELVAGCRPA